MEEKFENDVKFEEDMKRGSADVSKRVSIKNRIWNEFLDKELQD